MRLVHVPFAILGLGCALAYLSFGLEWSTEIAAAVKPVPALCAAILVAFAGRSRLHVMVTSGLVISAIGDLYLVVDARFFIHGLVSFLLAHLCYIAGVIRRYRISDLVFALPILLWVCTMAWFVLPHAGPLAPALSAYMLVIGAMMFAALCRACREGGRSAWMFLGGAVSFGLSDSCLAWSMFIGPFTAHRTWVMVTYWLAQGLIAASCLGRVSRGQPH